MLVATRTSKQRLNDYLYSQVEIVNQAGGNKRIHCKKCTHNFSGSITRIYEHLTGKAGDVKACSFSQTIDKPAVLREIHALEYALPKVKKRKAADVSDREHASSSGAKQMPIQQSMQAAGSLGVDQALADWVYEQGIPFNVFR